MDIRQASFEKMPTVRDIIGLIPAAGIARRLSDLSQSKEILPVVFGSERAGLAAFAKPACHHLLEGFRSAGVTKALMVLRTGKWDIPACLAQNPVQGVDLSYIVIEESAGVPWTLDRAYPFVSGSDVVMGFPDILIRPTTLYRQMVEELRTGRSDVVLGVMPTSNPSKADVVKFTDDGKVDSIRPKPDGLLTARVWIAAAWRPSFTQYMHDFLVDNPVSSATERELYLGDILAAALAELDVFAVVCEEGRFIDIGTPEDLADVRAES